MRITAIAPYLKKGTADKNCGKCEQSTKSALFPNHCKILFKRHLERNHENFRPLALTKAKRTFDKNNLCDEYA